MYEFNNKIKDTYYYKNIVMKDKGVVCRFDFNVPLINNIISDDFRISSTIPTIQQILSSKPKYIVLTSHFGRPEGIDLKYSLEFLVPVLEKYLNQKIIFLKNGISEETLININDIVSITPSTIPIFLLENLRFYKEETDYDKITDKNNNQIIKLYRRLGDVFISDAFGCVHRNHMSICDMKISGKLYGYGKLIKKELDAISILCKQNHLKILGIIGGNKIKDKMPLINALRQISNSKLFIAGGLAKQYNEIYENVFVMHDGYGNTSLEKEPLYIPNKNTDYNFYDICDGSYNKLIKLINEADIIFWNGSLGVIEHKIYKNGSLSLVDYLEKVENKKIIIGGGETASIFNNKNNNIYISTGGGALLEYLYNKIILNKNIVGLDIFL